MKNKMELVVDETTSLIKYLDGRNLRADVGLSVLISTMMAVARQLGLPNDILQQILEEAYATGKEMDDSQIRH